MTEQPVRILLVEDNEDYVMLIRDTLESRPEGYRVRAMTNPQGALELLGREHFDLVLLDYRFPKGNGLELIRDLKAKAEFIPTVMITAFGNEELAIQAMREGAMDFIPKTRDFLQALPSVVHRVLERSRIIQERIRTHEALERRNRELSILNGITSLLNRSLDLDQVLAEALEKVLELTELQGGWISLRTTEEEPFRLVAVHGLPQELNESTEEEAGGGLYREVLGTGRACLQPGALIQQGPGPAREGSHLLIPLRTKGEVLGLIHLLGPMDRRYKYEELELLTGIGNQVGVAVENARLYGELLRTKSYLEDLIENAGDEILTIDREGCVLTWNRGASEIYGYEKDAVVGKSWEMIIPEERRREMRALAERVLAGETVRDFETVRVRKGGEAADVVLTLSPVKDPSGAIVGISSLAKDVTRRKTLQSQLLQAEKMAAIGQLISGVAHELNNPLTAVIGYSQLVATEQTGDKTTGYLDKIASEGMRCQRIVHNLLTFARSHNSEKRLMDVNEALRSTLELREYELRVNDIEVVQELDESIPWTHGDYHQLQQVFMNIITNAQQALVSGGGHGRLEVRSSLVQPAEGAEGGPTIRVEFLDTGPGIPEQLRAKIFDPFFTTKEVGKGTGLGLSLSYGIVQEHGGHIETLPREKGAHFVVELPLRTGAEEPAAVREEQSLESEQESGSSCRILVVDDEPSVREMFCDILAPEGHTVEVADNGRTALEKIGGNNYDLIIADLKMPEFSGTDLYRTLLQRDPEKARRILFATGDVISADTKAFLEESGNAFISKPFGVQEIRERVRTFLVGAREDT